MGVQNEELYRDSKSGEIQDDYRIAFVQEHLRAIKIAMDRGANCFGYHM
jgi:beta-glucosidase/6-phospho-beta-glucosidase/beta-galactosidase